MGLDDTELENITPEVPSVTTSPDSSPNSVVSGGSVLLPQQEQKTSGSYDQVDAFLDRFERVLKLQGAPVAPVDQAPGVFPPSTSAPDLPRDPFPENTQEKSNPIQDVIEEVIHPFRGLKLGNWGYGQPSKPRQK